MPRITTGTREFSSRWVIGRAKLTHEFSFQKDDPNKQNVMAQEMYTIHILLNINLLYIFKLFFFSIIKVSRTVEIVSILGCLGDR